MPATLTDGRTLGHGSPRLLGATRSCINSTISIMPLAASRRQAPAADGTGQPRVRTEHYVYDSLDRLVRIEPGNRQPVTRFSYDPGGNRQTQHDASGMLRYRYAAGTNHLIALTRTPAMASLEKAALPEMADPSGTVAWIFHPTGVPLARFGL